MAAHHKALLMSALSLFDMLLGITHHACTVHGASTLDGYSDLQQLVDARLLKYCDTLNDTR